MSLLEIRDLGVCIDGHWILKNLNLELWQGYVHAVAGPNGAGKSTLAYTLMGLEGYPQSEGEILWQGESLAELSVDERARRGITLGWQEPARFEGLGISAYVRACPNPPGEAGTRELLAGVGLNPDVYWNRRADKTLSGGERKKLELASILAMKPKLAILDEPDSGIDVESLRRIHDAIGLLKEQGCTVLLITHSAEVLSWAEHAFLMCCGHIVEKGKTGKIGGYFESHCIPCDHKNRPEEEEFE